MTRQGQRSLLRHSVDDYAGSFHTDLLEQYKLYVQSAENVSARRVQSSRYLLTLNAAIVALYGIQSTGIGQSSWILLIPVIGILVSVLWFLIIKSHADLNRVKFDIIHELEEHLPAAVYQYEWQVIAESQDRGYRAVTTIERGVPILFVGLHTALGVVIFLAICGVVDWPK